MYSLHLLSSSLSDGDSGVEIKLTNSGSLLLIKVCVVCVVAGALFLVPGTSLNLSMRALIRINRFEECCNRFLFPTGGESLFHEITKWALHTTIVDSFCVDISKSRFFYFILGLLIRARIGRFEGSFQEQEISAHTHTHNTFN